MDNGQMARWVAQTEHIARMESQQRHGAFLRDIHPDDSAMQSTRAAGSRPVQPTGVVLFIRQYLASFTVRLEPKREPNLDCTEAGYEKNCV